MSKADRISGFFILLFAIFMGYLSHGSGLGTLHKPGPGFLFFWASVVLAGLSVTVIIRGWMQRREKTVPIFGPVQSYWKAAVVIVLSFLYAFFMESAGFIPVTLVFFLLVLGLIEKKGWPRTVFVSLLVTIIAYLLFETWLKSQLPKGLLESFRF